jgi:hypothetical protein
MTVPSDRKDAEGYTHSVITHALERTQSGTKHEAMRALAELLAENERLRAALKGYHDLAPALAECANECGEAVLYSQLHMANTAADVLIAARDGAA